MKGSKGLKENTEIPFDDITQLKNGHEVTFTYSRENRYQINQTSEHIKTEEFDT